MAKKKPTETPEAEAAATRLEIPLNGNTVVQVFKTYHVPGLCTVPLGVTDDIAPGLMGQLRFPLVAWARAYLPAAFKSRAPQDVQEISV